MKSLLIGEFDKPLVTRSGIAQNLRFQLFAEVINGPAGVVGRGIHILLDMQEAIALRDALTEQITKELASQLSP